MQKQTSRLMDSASTFNRLSNALIISVLGSNKLKIDSRGNPFTREDGTAIMIFNLNAFASQADADAAVALWVKGTASEKAGDLVKADEIFKQASNKRLSFSVLASNAPDYAAAHEITCSVDEIVNSKGVKTIVVNKPKPVAVSVQGSSAASLFAKAQAAHAAPAGTSGAPTETAAEKRKRIAAEKKAAKIAAGA